MRRIIAGVAFERADTPYAWDVRIHDLGHGHVEGVVLPRYAWAESEPLSPLARDDALRCGQGLAFLAGEWAPYEKSVVQQQADDLANRERATRRARTKVRRLCKVKGLTTLLTLTYRENMCDRQRMARDFDAFVKRVRRRMPGFEYVCAFETQKRGAWHAHIAVKRVQAFYVVGTTMVKSYDLLRSMWRGVVGNDNGNVDVSRNRNVQRSSAKLASYLSKYIGKTFNQAAKHVNSYSSSGRDLPEAVLERVDSASDAFGALFDLLAPEVQASEVFTSLIPGGGMYLCLSPPSVPVPS
uniref:Replication-associated protein ORF2/G2P domain-containing protein n=1 Tax=uncultured prokaryote TaxID=198431 RepID=A0A0H5Q412_9ZZZZ|nr:hypothetical protein [uncultured prokaryote]